MARKILTLRWDKAILDPRALVFYHVTLRRQGLWVTLRSRSQNLAIWVLQRMLGQLWFYANLDLAVVVLCKIKFRFGSCGFMQN